MLRVSVEPGPPRVRAGSGCLLENIDEATADHGLVVPVGVVSETGVAGLALGGGISWFSRKHGLTCDSFESLEVVTAAGETIRTSSTEHPRAARPRGLARRPQDVDAEAALRA